MDPSEVLPPEICIQIFNFLGPEDLSRCLAVSHRWRDLASDGKIWRRFCKTHGLVLSSSTKKKADTLPLSLWATEYISYMNRLVSNWKENTFDSFKLIKEDWCCSISGFERNVAVYYPRTSNVYIYHISENIDVICDIHVALPNAISIPDVFIDEYFLVVARNNVVLIYKNNKDSNYTLYKIIMGHEYGLTVSNDMFPLTENGKRLYVKVISKNTIWVESDLIYVVNLLSGSYKVLNDTFRCLKVDGNRIFTANNVITSYDLQGDKIFSLNIRFVEDMWIKDKTIVVLREEDCQQLEVWDVDSKKIQCSINVHKDPSISISRDSEKIFVLEIINESYAVSCFSVQSGFLIWAYNDRIGRDITVHPEIRIICDRFILARPSYTSDNKFILIDSKTGNVVYDSMMPPSLQPPSYIYYLSDELFITAESNSIHIRSYI